jgi:hypothetical protein
LFEYLEKLLGKFDPRSLLIGFGLKFQTIMQGKSPFLVRLNFLQDYFHQTLEQPNTNLRFASYSSAQI